jgi:GT2 family glycosyltransferase
MNTLQRKFISALEATIAILAVACSVGIYLITHLARSFSLKHANRKRFGDKYKLQPARLCSFVRNVVRGRQKILVAAKAHVNDAMKSHFVDLKCISSAARAILIAATSTGNTDSEYIQKAYPDHVEANLLANGPLISVIVPLYKTPLNYLIEAVDSVRQQIYERWELIVVDDHSEDPAISLLMQRLCHEEPRIKYKYKRTRGNIASALNDGLAECKGQWYLVLDHDDKLHPAALYWIARSVVSHPDIVYIYSDEDKIDKSGTFHYGPFFKPDWCPEYTLGMMYTCHLSAFRTDLVSKLGGYRDEFTGAQDYDLMLRVTSHTDKIFHIPHVLYHWRVWENSTAQTNTAKPYAKINAVKALREHLAKQSDNVKVEDHQHEGHYKVTFLPIRFPLVSIVIPTANGHVNVAGRLQENLRSVCESIRTNTSYPNYEILVAHNGDLSADQLKWLQSSTQIKEYKYEDRCFNLARKINNAVRLSNGEYVLLMNDDVRVKTPNWLELMAGMAERPGVGVVGPRLLFPNGTVQHAGVVLLGGLPGHAYYEWPRNAFGYAMGLQLNRGYSAVTGACCLTPRSLFDRLAGFSERYKLNYNDVDYCLRARELGYRSVYLADAELYHYEGVSKDGGRSVSTEEISMFLSDWGDKYAFDPMYNPNLSQSVPYGGHN